MINAVVKLIQALIDLLFKKMVLKFDDMLPDTTWLDKFADKLESMEGSLCQIFKGVGYFFPPEDLQLFFDIIIAWITFRITWALIIRAKSFIPTMGN